MQFMTTSNALQLHNRLEYVGMWPFPIIAISQNENHVGHHYCVKEELEAVLFINQGRPTASELR